MAWDIIFVLVIVACAALFMGSRLYRTVKNKGACAAHCGKSGSAQCSAASCAGCARREIIRRK